jgi:hypothetical protein
MPKKQYPLRLDTELYEVIEHWANDEFRSVNAHIEFLLKDAAKRAGRLRKKASTKSKGDEEPRD